MKVWARFGAVFDRTLGLFAVLSGVAIVFMMLSVSLDVVMRYALNSPITGILELNEYALLYATFLGTAWVLKRMGHVTVELIANQLKSKARTMLDIVTSILGAVACGVLTVASAQSTWDHFVRGAWDPGSVLEVPAAAVLVIVPVGSFLLFIQFIRRTSDHVMGWGASSTGRGET